MTKPNKLEKRIEELERRVAELERTKYIPAPYYPSPVQPYPPPSSIPNHYKCWRCGCFVQNGTIHFC